MSFLPSLESGQSNITISTEMETKKVAARGRSGCCPGNQRLSLIKAAFCNQARRLILQQTLPSSVGQDWMANAVAITRSCLGLWM